MIELIENMKKTQDKVRLVMEHFPETRNNDNLLCQVYWRIVDGVEDLDGIQFATSAEAIRRNRQLLNARNILLPTDPKVIKKRKQRAKEIKMGITKM